MARARRLQREEVRAQRGLVRGAVGPEGAARLPVRAEPLVVRDRVLDDERLHALRMCERHAEADGPAVVVHVERVARQPERLREPVHELGDVVERVRELLRIRPVAVPEARVVGGHEAVAVRQPGEERLELARRARYAVEQQDDGRALRPRLAVEDRHAVDLRASILRSTFHRALPFFTARGRGTGRAERHERDSQLHASPARHPVTSKMTSSSTAAPSGRLATP